MNDLSFRVRKASFVVRVGVVAVLVGCATAPRATAPHADLASPSGVAPQPAQQVPPDGDARLTTSVRPLKYELALDIDPRVERFSGVTRIVVDVREPTSQLVLHAGDITIKDAFATSAETRAWPARVERGAHGGLALHFKEALRGEVVLTLRHDGPLTEVPDSLYRVHEGNDWYAFTQFEALDARNTFPCFDEPQFKTPFRVELRVPRGMTALSNAPVEATSDDGDYVKVRFAETRPLPTYLVAFAVGEFERYSAPLGGLQHSIYATRGKIGEAAYVAAQTGPILGALANYFGIAYPFAKLDQIAVPVFRAGAMENVGLVTYRDHIILLDPQTASPRNKIVSRSIVAHELAHMWFGNLVTMQWWDDVWLNEAFATWMANKVMTKIAPELESEEWAVGDMLNVMSEDALSFATPIRKQIRDSGDVDNAFDGITYQKGLAVLRMLEGWISPEAFQQGVRTYLNAHLYQNATMDDFVGALAAQTTLPVADVARSFISQAGTPVIAATTSCQENPGGGATLTVAMTQERYVPLGVDRERSLKNIRPWSVPVCLRLQRGTLVSEVRCALLSSSEGVVEHQVEQCPNSIYPNADEAGYYHWQLPAAELAMLSERAPQDLSLKERVGFPRQAQALFESGQLAAVDYLRLLAKASKDPHRLVVSGVIEGLWLIQRTLPPGTDKTAFREFAEQLLGPHVDRVGLTPRPGESTDHALLRQELFSAYGALTASPALLTAAQALVKRLKQDPSNMDIEQLQILLPMAARHGDANLHADLVALLNKATPTMRDALIVALGCFDDPALLHQSYNLVLQGTIRPTEMWTLRAGLHGSEERYQHYFQWLQSNVDKLIEASGRGGTNSIPVDAGGQCTADGKQAAVALFTDVERRFGPGAEHNLDTALEWADRCIATRAHHGPALAAPGVFGAALNHRN